MSAVHHRKNVSDNNLNRCFHPERTQMTQKHTHTPNNIQYTHTLVHNTMHTHPDKKMY